MTDDEINNLCAVIRGGGWELCDDEPSLTMSYQDGSAIADEIERLQARVAELEQRGEPVAWRTEYSHGYMLWNDENEAARYCNDDERPIPLYLAAPSPEDK